MSMGERGFNSCCHHSQREGGGVQKNKLAGIDGRYFLSDKSKMVGPYSRAFVFRDTFSALAVHVRFYVLSVQ